MRLLETARFQPVHCSSDFILYSWIYLFLCWVYPAHDSMKCRLLLLFCDHKKNSSFISTRSVRLTFCFPLSGSAVFFVNKILNKVYLEHWFSSCSWWIKRSEETVLIRSSLMPNRERLFAIFIINTAMYTEARLELFKQ